MSPARVILVRLRCYPKKALPRVSDELSASQALQLWMYVFSPIYLHCFSSVVIYVLTDIIIVVVVVFVSFSVLSGTGVGK